LAPSEDSCDKKTYSNTSLRFFQLFLGKSMIFLLCVEALVQVLAAVQIALGFCACDWSARPQHNKDEKRRERKGVQWLDELKKIK
jgi:hypothetical protein